jgi:hypothetical protein
VLSIATAGAYAAIAAATIAGSVKGFAMSFAVGAAAGAVSGFASSTVEQLIDPGDIDWQRAGLSALIGGAIGGVSGAAQYKAIYAAQAKQAGLRTAATAQAKVQIEATQMRIDAGAPQEFGRPGMHTFEARIEREEGFIKRLTGTIAENKAFFLKQRLITAGVSYLSGTAAWGVDLLVPTPTAGGVPTPLPPAIAPEDGTVDVGSEGAVLLDEAFG